MQLLIDPVEYFFFRVGLEYLSGYADGDCIYFGSRLKYELQVADIASHNNSGR